MAHEKASSANASPAVIQAAQILQALGAHPDNEMNLTEICHVVGIHKSKGFSILNALAQYDMVVKDSRTKIYTLGPALLPLAFGAVEKLDIHTLARPHLEKLAEQTLACVLLGVIHGDQFYIAAKYHGRTDFSVSVGKYQAMDITHGAHGKAIFAFLGPEEKKRIMERGIFFFHGRDLPLDRPRLEKEVEACRRSGYAFDPGDLTPGVRAVSAPVFDHQNQVTAGVVVVGTFSKDHIDAHGRMAAEAAEAVSRRMGASHERSLPCRTMG